MPLPQIPFDHFPTMDELSAWMEQFAAAAPQFARLSSLGTSRGGRNIPLLILTNFETGSPDDRPGYVLQGVFHADELAGILVTLDVGRRLVESYKQGESPLDQIAFYLIPCINPDGATYVLETGGSEIRSRLDRTRLPNTLYQEDVNGDGLILKMIRQEPNGNLVKDPQDPRLLIARTPESKGPFYRQYNEGYIHDWDGTEFRTVNHYVDWNRNFAAHWAPEPLQDAAGDFPFSESETAALARFIADHRRLFGYVGFHGGSGSLSVAPEIPIQNTIDHGDRAVLRELGKLGEECTSYPFYLGTEFNLPPWRWMNPLGERHGAICDYLYFHNGIPAVEFELGSLKNCAGVSTLDFDAIESIPELNAKMRQVMAWLDKQTNPPPVFHPWTPFHHPQLGEVEIGGFDARYMNTPVFSELQHVAERIFLYILKSAAFAPKAVAEDIQATPMGGGIWRLRLTAGNRGKFPTCVTNKGRALRRMRQPRVDFMPAEGVELLSLSRHIELGHLDGYTGEKHLEWFVRAPEEIRTLGTVVFDASAAGVQSVTFTK